MKIYTKGGDKGITSLVSGKRVSKNNLRLEAYGTVDELVTDIAVFRDLITDNLELQADLIHIQSALMVISSHLANDSESIEKQLPPVRAEWSQKLEQKIDEMDRHLTPLQNFVIPGGNLLISRCHICRVSCRRTERRVVALSEAEPVNKEIIAFLNRLSDYFFTLARYLIMQSGIEEIQWNPDFIWE